MCISVWLPCNCFVFTTGSAHVRPVFGKENYSMYVRRNTVRRFRGYHSRDSADAFDDSDCADALKQICRYPLTVPQIPFDASVDIL